MIWKWTRFKLNSLGLSSYFDHLEIIDENKHYKEGDDWKRAASGILVPPTEVLVVGDNIKGDIQASSEAGFEQVVWIDKKGGWKLYREDTLPSKVITIGRVDELLRLGES